MWKKKSISNLFVFLTLHQRILKTVFTDPKLSNGRVFWSILEAIDIPEASNTLVENLFTVTTGKALTLKWLSAIMYTFNQLNPNFTNAVVGELI